MHVHVLQVSIEALRQLDEYLFETYIEKKSDPIVGSLEPGIYAGYFDWKDCLPPTGITHLNRAMCILITLCGCFYKMLSALVLKDHHHADGTKWYWKDPQTLLLVLILQFQSAVIAFVSQFQSWLCVYI